MTALSELIKECGAWTPSYLPRHTCYAKSIKGLAKHIKCCKENYPHCAVILSDLSTPEQNGTPFYKVPMYAGLGICPAHKVCEEVL